MMGEVPKADVGNHQHRRHFAVALDTLTIRFTVQLRACPLLPRAAELLPR